MASISFSALRLASELGHREAGEEHLVVSWLEADLPQDQRQVLEALGLTGDRARAALVATTADDNRRDPESGTMSGPTYHRARGRARGLAVAAGRTVPSNHDVLRACLLDEGPASRLLATMGVSRSDVMLCLGHVVEDLPSDTLSGPATEQAMALSGAFVGSWHFVLALLADHPDAVAGDALRDCGITHDDYSRWLAAWLSRSEPPVWRLAPGSSPEMSLPGHEILGRAEGFAVASASPVVRSCDGVLAWLWDDFGHAVSELEILGTTAGAFVDALAAQGVNIPTVPLPEPDRRPWGERVHFPPDRRKDVLARLLAELKPGDWGWNRCGDEFWVVAIADVDLSTIVADVLSSDGS